SERTIEVTSAVPLGIEDGVILAADAVGAVGLGLDVLAGVAHLDRGAAGEGLAGVLAAVHVDGVGQHGGEGLPGVEVLRHLGDDLAVGVGDEARVRVVVLGAQRRAHVHRGVLVGVAGDAALAVGLEGGDGGGGRGQGREHGGGCREEVHCGKLKSLGSGCLDGGIGLVCVGLRLERKRKRKLDDGMNELSRGSSALYTCESLYHERRTMIDLPY
ncbi:uncharacterized protein BO95DRAFT_498214, partial [Aspergillus brunneoviolaceus CBS 621.78]